MEDNLQNIKKLKLLSEQILKDKNTTHGLGRSLRSLGKEIAIYESHLDNDKKHYFKGVAEKVQIGGGKHKLEGFLNIDIFEPADIIYDLREGIPLEDNSVNFIFTEHFFEHIDYPKSAKFFVNECFRVLKSKGKIILGVPDGEAVINGYLRKDKKLFKEYLDKWYSNRDCKNDFNTYIDLINYHFRDQDDSEKYNPHFWDYDFEKLKDLFLTIGFSKVIKWKFDSSIANPKREFGSIYIQAIK